MATNHNKMLNILVEFKESPKNAGKQILLKKNAVLSGGILWQLLESQPLFKNFYKGVVWDKGMQIALYSLFFKGS